MENFKTNLDTQFKTDRALEEEGVDFAISDKVKFRCRRFHANNPRVKAALAAYMKPFARQAELGTLPVEKNQEIMMKLFIDVSLVGWTGLEDDKGQPIEFSKENALKLFTSLPEVFDALWKYANDFEPYKESLGNS